MATFVVCTRCSKTLEIAAIDQLPDAWLRTDSGLLCPRCTGAEKNAAFGDVLDEEVIYPHAGADTLDESFEEEECEICCGPCQGH
jgi:hypothetical protein